MSLWPQIGFNNSQVLILTSTFMALVSALIILRCISKPCRPHQMSLGMMFLLAVFNFRILIHKQLKIEMLHETLSEQSAKKLLKLISLIQFSVPFKHLMALGRKSRLMWELWELCSRGFPVPQSFPEALIDSGVWNTAHAASKIAGWPHPCSAVSSDKNQLSPIREGQSETGLPLQTAAESDEHSQRHTSHHLRKYTRH